MTDQQDLRARLPELPEPVVRCYDLNDNPIRVYTAEDMRAYALEAAAQLGRVGDETIDCEIAVAPATIFSVGVKLSTVVSAVRARKEAEGTFAFTAKVRDRVAEPQLPAGVPVVSDEMVERACKRYAFREDGAAFPDDYTEHEVAAERHLMREFLEHTIQSAPQPDSKEPR